MTFKTAVLTCLTTNYCQFRGRAPRSEYWWFALFNLIVACIWVCIVGFSLAFFTSFMSWELFRRLIHGLFALVNLALLLPNLGVSVRRLHDINKSGWWLLISLIPILGGLVLLWFFLKAGTPGPNTYGADPLA